MMSRKALQMFRWAKTKLREKKQSKATVNTDSLKLGTDELKKTR